MKAVVMAGGEGSRLRPLTIGRPKPLITIVNKPVMEHVLDLLKAHGVTEIIVTVQYLASMIQDYFGDGSALGMKMTYSVEDTPLGTAGSVKAIERELTEPFLVISADALTDINVAEAIQFHRERKAIATLVLYHVPNPLEYGVVITAEDGRIRQFLEKPSWGEVFSDTVNTGMYVLEPEVLQTLEGGRPVDFSHDVFPKLLQDGAPLFGYIASGYWCDVGNLSAYLMASADLLYGRVKLPPVGIDSGGGIFVGGEDIEIAGDAQLFGPVYLGAGTQIRSGAIIHGPSVIRMSCVVDRGAHIDRSVIWSGSYVGERAEVRGVIVGRQCSVKAKALVFEGVVVGDRTSVSEDAIIQPNVKIWPDKEIERGATVTSSIIWGAQGRRVLFGRWGVSGLANVDLNPEFAAKLGAAYGATLPRGSAVIMNRDSDRSSRMIKRAMIAGLPSSGIDVLDTKQAPIPVARYLSRVSEAVGGVHVRVSPFDRRIIDVKFFDARGLDIDKNTERKIENSFFREDYRRAYLDEVGRIFDVPQLVERYVEGFCAAVDLSAVGKAEFNRKLVVDFSHSSSSSVLPTILNQMGLDVVSLNASIDETKLARDPSEINRSMEELATITGSLRAGLGVRLDPGGERIQVADDTGAVIPGFQLLAAATELALRAESGKDVVVPVSAPNVFETIAERHGARVTRTPVNPAAIMAAASQKGVAIAGDGNGGIIFPRLQPAFDGLFAISHLVELLAQQGVSLGEVVRALPPFYMASGRVPCPWETKGKVMRLLAERFRDRRTRQIDGVRIALGREWALVLPDADRPLFHVIAESTTPSGAQALLAKYSALVSGLQH